MVHVVFFSKAIRMSSFLSVLVILVPWLCIDVASAVRLGDDEEQAQLVEAFASYGNAVTVKAGQQPKNATKKLPKKVTQAIKARNTEVRSGATAIGSQENEDLEAGGNGGKSSATTKKKKNLSQADKFNEAAAEQLGDHADHLKDKMSGEGQGNKDRQNGITPPSTTPNPDGPGSGGKGKSDVPDYRPDNKTRLLDLIKKSTIPANMRLSDKPQPTIPGISGFDGKEGKQSKKNKKDGKMSDCNGWSPDDKDKPLFGQGAKCDYNGWSLKWCWVDKEEYLGQNPGDDAFMKHSAIYPGKYFALCEPGQGDEDEEATGPDGKRHIFKKEFRDIDTNSDGSVTAAEIESYTKDKGTLVPAAEVEKALQEHDEDKDGQLSPEEFDKFWPKLIFKQIDQDGSGKAKALEIKQYMLANGKHLPDNMTEEIIKEGGAENDEVTEAQFIELMPKLEAAVQKRPSDSRSPREKKAQKLGELADGMRAFAKEMKYNSSLKTARAQRAELDLNHISEKADLVKASARKSQRDADEQQEAAKIIAFQADVAAKKEIASLNKDLKNIKHDEAEDGHEADNIRLNVTRRQALAERARQQAEQVAQQSKLRRENAHRAASDLARKAEMANKVAAKAEEDAQAAERDALEEEKDLPDTTTYVPTEEEAKAGGTKSGKSSGSTKVPPQPEASSGAAPGVDHPTTPGPGPATTGSYTTGTTTTSTTTVTTEPEPEALMVQEANYKKLNAAIARDAGMKVGQTMGEAASKEAEDLIRDSLHMPPVDSSLADNRFQQRTDTNESDGVSVKVKVKGNTNEVEKSSSAKPEKK